MSAREELHAEVDALPEPDLPKAHIVVDEDESDVVGLPDAWRETLTGEPMPNVVAAVRRVRESH
jgi:hypothetical protein